MSKLLAYRRAEEELRRQLAQLEEMKKDKELSKEMEFEDQLKELLDSYGFKLQQAVAILDEPRPEDYPHLQQLLGNPQVARAQASQEPKRRVRRLQVWKNPHSGEVLETKSGNNKTLKAWKAEFGEDVVAGWLQPQD